MDDSRALRSIQDNEFEKVGGLVWSQDEVAVGVFADLIDGESMDDGVLDVLGVDAVTQG